MGGVVVMSDHWKRFAGEVKMNRLQYMTRKAAILAAVNGFVVPFYVIQEAVASEAIEHPEWDLEMKKTYEEWDRDVG